MRTHREHLAHEHRVVNTDHIRNVPYLLTHDLVQCEEDRFYGWIPKGEA